MYNAIALTIALWTGQTSAPPPPLSHVERAQVMPSLVAQAAQPSLAPAALQDAGPSKVVTPAVHHQAGPALTPGTIQVVSHHDAGPASASCNTLPCTPGCSDDCRVTWLKRWKCEDLEMKPVERKCHSCECGLLHRLLWCPKEEEKENGNGNGKDEKKNGNGKDEKKNGNGEKKDGNGEEEKEEEEPDLTPLMQLIKCRAPGVYERMECRGIKAYGWVQQGFTANFDSPNDRLNFGVNWNDRSNDYQLNQAYIVLEKPLDLDKKKDEFHLGFRLDFFAGHDAPNIENFGLGLFDNVTGNRLNSPRTTEFGISAPQFYLEAHLPVLTDRGIDVKAGRFYTLLGYEVNPAPSTDFYSHSYEFFYSVPFTNFGFMSNTHIGDTVDFYNAFVRGWEVNFQDTNDVWGYMGGLTWNACDKRQTVALAWICSPEQIGNNNNYRTVMSAYYTRKFGCRDQWRFVGGGHVGWEEDAVVVNGVARPAEWYGSTGYLFYTIDPRLILGARAEIFRDDDGVRTAYLNRPGFADNFWEVTFGVTWKPYQNLRIRPELRFDGSSQTRPYNDLQDKFQTTFAFDVIYEF